MQIQQNEQIMGGCIMDEIQGAYHNSLRHSKKLHNWMKIRENEGIQKRCTQ
jgi:hypothetical protein